MHCLKVLTFLNPDTVNVSIVMYVVTLIKSLIEYYIKYIAARLTIDIVDKCVETSYFHKLVPLVT